MKRKILVLLSLVCALCCVLALVACNDKPNNGGDDGKVTVSGTYYYCENDVLDDTMYITFKNGSWTDDEDQSGSYKLSDNAITLTLKNGDEYASGTVNGNDITLNILGANWLYRKGEDISTKVKAKTLDYQLSQDRTYYIVKGIGGLTGDVVVPDEYKKKPVKEIAENAFANCSDLTGIVVGDNVTTIGKKAFYKCANLTSVTLGESVNAVEESTFEECRKMETITISASVKSIGKKAFYFCLALKDIYFTGTASDWAQIDFYYYIGYNSIEVCNPLTDNTTYIVGNNTASADYTSRNLYVDGELMTSAVIDADVSPFAFYGYNALTSVTINGATKIGEYAFYDCAELTNLQFSGSKLTKIGEGAFESCAKLQSVTLPSSLRRIDKYAFNNCSELATINTGNGVTYIAYGAFMSCGKLSALTLGSSVSEICEAAFYGCEALTTVSIPSSAIFIGKDAFWGTSLTSATFANKEGWIVNKDVPLESEQLEDVENAAMLLTTSVLQQGYADTDWERKTVKYTLSSDGTYYIVSNVGTACRSEIVIPAEYLGKPVRALGDLAFNGCKALVSITIPDSVTDIGYIAFEGCSNLQSVYYMGDLAGWCGIRGVRELLIYNRQLKLYIGGSEVTGDVVIPDGVTAISDYAFYNCIGITSVTIPSSVTSIGGDAFSGCNNITAVYYTGDIAGWCGVSGLGSLLNSSMTLYIDGKQLAGELVIPEGVTSIANYAFYYCKGITSVTISNGVTSVGYGAFFGCDNLVSVTLPTSLTNIADRAFGGLSIINYAGDVAGWCAISGLKNLMDYTQDKTLYIGGSEVKDLVIPGSVAEIPVCAFYYCASITSVTISSGVTSIGSSAFYGCTNLVSVSISDTVTDIKQYVFERCNALQVIDVDAGNDYYASVDGILYNYAKTQFVHVPKAVNGAVVIPDTITSIDDHTFRDGVNLTSVTIPSSVTSIGVYAFDNCVLLANVVFGGNASIAYEAFGGCTSLTSVTIAASPSIDRWAFVSCSSLVNVVLGESVTSISEEAFYNCDALQSITVDANNQYYASQDGILYNKAKTEFVCIPYALTGAITIPDGMTSITGVFFRGNITSMTIPSSVTNIANYVFDYCSSLTSVTFNGTKEQWANVYERLYVWASGRNVTVHCTNGDIVKPAN